MYFYGPLFTCLFNKLIFILNRFGPDFITYHKRPKYAKSIGTLSDPLRDQPKIAIVMQGPLIKENNFTLETIKLYKHHFPESLVIISTWNTEDSKLLDTVSTDIDALILNEKPPYSGISNINFQLVSSYNGILKAKELGAEYVLKTRTDQRMYAPNIFEYFLNLLTHFQMNISSLQYQRLIGISLNTFKYRMYGISDMTIFGHINDQLLYWNADLDMRHFTETEVRQFNTSLRNFAKWRACEVYIVTEFLRKLNRPLHWTLEDSWNVFAEHFIIVDKESVDLFWPKYKLNEYRGLSYLGTQFKAEMTFCEWFNLFQGFKKKARFPESILDIPFNSI